jgi:hypothetical protein
MKYTEILKSIEGKTVRTVESINLDDRYPEIVITTDDTILHIILDEDDIDFFVRQEAVK